MVFPQRSPGRVLLATSTIVAVVFAAILHAGAVIAIWSANRVNVENLGHLVGVEPSSLGVLDSVALDQCIGYSGTIALLYTEQFESLPAEQQLKALDQMADCQQPERRSMLTPWIVTAKWKMGRYGEVCESLLALNGPHRLLELARRSLNEANWEGVEAALECVNRFPPDGAWMSPFIVSQLYYALGQHREDQGNVHKALQAYDSAARWYPVVWSAPYIKKAALLWRLGAHDEAIEWLVDGLVQSADVTATFHLWRELGNYWLQQGNENDAACAYYSAMILADQVPSQNVTASEITQLHAQLSTLGVPSSTAACFKRYPQLRVNRYVR